MRPDRNPRPDDVLFQVFLEDPQAPITFRKRRNFTLLVKTFILRLSESSRRISLSRNPSRPGAHDSRHTPRSKRSLVPPSLADARPTTMETTHFFRVEEKTEEVSTSSSPYSFMYKLFWSLRMLAEGRFFLWLGQSRPITTHHHLGASPPIITWETSKTTSRKKKLAFSP